MSRYIYSEAKVALPILLLSVHTQIHKVTLVPHNRDISVKVYPYLVGGFNPSEKYESQLE